MKKIIHRMHNVDKMEEEDNHVKIQSLAQDHKCACRMLKKGITVVFHVLDVEKEEEEEVVVDKREYLKKINIEMVVVQRLVVVVVQMCD